MRWAIVVAAACLLAGCGMVRMNANEGGGTANYGLAVSQQQVNDAVREHCSKYGRVPRVANAQAAGAGANVYQFECVQP